MKTAPPNKGMKQTKPSILELRSLSPVFAAFSQSDAPPTTAGVACLGPEMVEWRPLPGIPERKYPWDWNRITSALLVVVWLAILGFAAGLEGLLRGALDVALPLACIWFADSLGSMTTAFPSVLSNVAIDRTAPGCLVRVLGWVVLLVITVGRVLAVALM